MLNTGVDGQQNVIAATHHGPVPHLPLLCSEYFFESCSYSQDARTQRSMVQQHNNSTPPAEVNDTNPLEIHFFAWVSLSIPWLKVCLSTSLRFHFLFTVPLPLHLSLIPCLFSVGTRDIQILEGSNSKPQHAIWS